MTVGRRTLDHEDDEHHNGTGVYDDLQGRDEGGSQNKEYHGDGKERNNEVNECMDHVVTRDHHHRCQYGDTC